MNKWMLGFVVFIASVNIYAGECAKYSERIHKLEDLRRHGGKLKQMERWRMQSDELAAKFSQCSREQSIQVASGSSNGTTKSSRVANKSSLKLRKTNSADPQVQKLLSTCNYWIAEYNSNPSDSNSSFKDTACHALDDQLANTEPNASPPVLKSLSECIKPNNLIDNDVQECRQGRRDPIWKTQ